MKPLYLEDVREENQKLLNKYNMEEIALTTCNNTFDNIRLKMNRKKHLEAFHRELVVVRTSVKD